MFKRVVVLALAAVVGSSLAQQIPDLPERDPKNTAVRDAVKTRVDAGKAALAAKDFVQASRHFANALWWDPFSGPVLGSLVDATAASEDAQTLWAHDLAAATADERGSFDLEGPLKKLAPRDPFLAKVAAARAEAVAQLASALKDARGKDGDQALAARWAIALAQDLVAPAPALRKKHGAAFNQALAAAPLDFRPVLLALKEVMDKHLGEQHPELAVRAAQCLLGLSSQSKFKDLEGPKPTQLEAVAIAARTGLARAREQMDAKRKGAVPTIVELEMMTPEEREKFTREHASFENPGVTLSPNGLYRIETSCGHATLLGVAKTIELHHARLVKYFGQEPFAGQPGLVRVVPESSGLEAEGTPYWWAGGFQSGSVTTVKFSCGTISGLGHGLTHELTHRFDGAVNAGIPSWLAEGKAVWTGGSYGGPEDPTFVPNHASFGTVEAGYLKGYGDEAKLKKLVEGTLEDYRDNYTAGYGLFLYLSTWKEKDAAIFADRLLKFEHGCREKGGNSFEWFGACFCDGRAGRPKDFKGFTAKFGEFLKGFYWQSRAPWTGTLYTQKVPASEGGGYVFDAPTWHQARNRAEPWFGQDQARIAGDILLEAGRKREAASAFEWSLCVDEWSADVAEKLVRLLEQENRSATAWAVRNEWARRFGAPLPPAAAPSPLRVPKAEAYAEVLRAARDAYSAAGKPIAATAMAADYDRVAARLGMKRVPVAPITVDPGVALHLLDEPPRALGLLGWEEDKLTNYEERRVKNLWYEVPEGDLHVGRTPNETETSKTGVVTLARAAHQRDAFVRTREWIGAGRYAITMRIQVTTSYVAGSVVIGFTRRDRNVRWNFSGGDFLYSVGAKEEKTQFDSIGTHLIGLKERDSGLSSAQPWHPIKFKPPTNAFVLKLLVDGPEVHAFVNDELTGNYHTTDGSSVEGYIGFASGQGAYLVSSASVQRRDRSAAAGTDATWPKGLDLAVAGRQSSREIMNLACRGIPVSPAGALVLWIPDLGTASAPALAIDYTGLAASVATGLDEALKSADCPASFVVALPECAGEEVRKSVEADLKFNSKLATGVIIHRQTAALSTQMEGDNGVPEAVPTLIFVDPQSVVRAAAKFERGQRTLPGTVHQWLAVFESLASIAKKSSTDPKGG